jgi:ribosome biogenesis GTPase
VKTDGTIYICGARGIFRKDGISPLTGDYVEIDILSEENLEGNVVEILPRKNFLIRPSVANVDQIAFVFSIKSPAPDLFLLDKLSVAACRWGIGQILCLNKTDLVKESDYSAIAKAYGAAGFEVVPVSCKTMEGIDRLSALLSGKITVFAGQSGVGKSTILNSLPGEGSAAVGELSARIQRGKHTTRHTEMIPLPGGGYIIDTPGFSIFDPQSVRFDNVKLYFPEFAASANKCRFNECVHINEPDCDVKRRVEAGDIDTGRYERYIKLYDLLKKSAYEELTNARRTSERSKEVATDD